MRLEDVIVEPEALKRLFRRERKHNEGRPSFDNWGIRLHRSLSWYERSLDMAVRTEGDRDLHEPRLVMLWVSLCALCSSWDSHRLQPVSERLRMLSFLEELHRVSEGQALQDFIGRERAPIRALLACEPLLLVFWQNPFSPQTADQIERDLRLLDRLDPSTVPQILNQVLERVFILRGQIVHGASTAGSRYNRSPLHESLRLLQGLIPLLIHLCILYGIRMEWAPLCYPPFDPSNPAAFRALSGNGSSGG